jgi:hypothetical protein
MDPKSIATFDNQAAATAAAGAIFYTCDAHCHSMA